MFGGVEGVTGAHPAQMCMLKFQEENEEDVPHLSKKKNLDEGGREASLASFSGAGKIGKGWILFEVGRERKE